MMGKVTYAELAKHGDFGLGTFNDLDGEMIVELPETAAFLSAGLSDAGTSEAIKKAEG